MRKIFAILLLITSFFSCNNTHVDTLNQEDIAPKENVSEIWTHQIIQEYIDKNSEKFAQVNSTNISYILDIQKRNDKTYFVANIGYNFDFRFQTTQMLYIDSLNKQVFEYDTFNDSLILWPKSTHIDPSGSYELKTDSIFDKDMLISPTGEIFIKSFAQDKMIIFFEYMKGGPYYNTGSFLDTLNVTNNQLEDYVIDSIKTIITLFKEKDIERISNKIRYPLHRQYPIPPVIDKEEFKKRFNEIFDQTLIDKIVNSKISQWSEVGWRGIMLDNGDLWMANSDGVITTVNYQSDFEKNLRTNLIAKDKDNVHVSLKNFQSPVYKIKTNKYLIRIDELFNNNYRYASWKVDESESSKPDLVLNNGQWEHLGSGGNHVITFVNGIYTYKVYRNFMGEDNSPDITLKIEKKGEIIITADGTLLIE